MRKAKLERAIKPPSHSTAGIVRSRPNIGFGPSAEYYCGRTPYARRFFSELSMNLGLSARSFVLDLACGTGELSVGFAPYCGAVLGIDKSPEMLCARRSKPRNVRFLLADLNSEAVLIPNQADLVVIGRAIPYLERESLLPFLAAATKRSSSVLVCESTIAPENPWVRRYVSMRKRYYACKQPFDYTGQAFFNGSNWKLTGELKVYDNVRYNHLDLWRHSLSYPDAVYGILRDRVRFIDELESLLRPYYGSGNSVDVSIVSWCMQYTRG